jgi:hypothetical protein
MKKFRLFGLLFIVLAWNIFSADPPKGGNAPVAIVMKIINDVTCKKGSANWSPAKNGAALSTSDEVKTGDKSLALIKFTDNSIIRVRENSSLKIFADKNNGQLAKNTYIDKGKVGFNVSKQENEEFRFTTPTMVASIRGTEGYIGVGNDGNSLLVCTEGNIDIKATQGQKQSGNVKAGKYAAIGSDGTITAGDITPQQQGESNTMKKSNVKRLTIKTDAGELIIEYLGDN